MAFFIREANGPLIGELAFTAAEYERRLAAVRARLEREALDAFVSFAPENLFYLTGHDSPGYYFYQACVVTHGVLPINVLRKVEATNTLGCSWSRRVVEYEDTQDPVAATLWLLDELGLKGKTIGAEVEAFFVTPRKYEALRRGIAQGGGKLVDHTDVVEGARVVKSEEELNCIRRAGTAVEAAMLAAFDSAAEGVPEYHVAGIVMKTLIDNGSGYTGLPPFVTTGPRVNLAHSTWSDRIIQRGDSLSYELAASVNRYTCALYRPGMVGKPSAEFTRKLAVCNQSLSNILSAAKPGVTAGEVFAAGNAAFVEAGYDEGLGRRLGYSVGISYPPDWGEGHIIDFRRDSAQVLKAGMAFHATPALIALDGATAGMSETIIITDQGAEAVTKLPREVYIV